MSPRRVARLTMLALLCALSACVSDCREETDPGEPGETVIDSEAPAPPPMSAGTLRALGPHVWEATLDIRGDASGQWKSVEVASKLVWVDLDRFSFERVQNGAMRRSIRVGEHRYSQRSDDGKYVESRETSGGSLIHQRTLQLWDEALGPFIRSLAWSRLPDDVVEGRPAQVWKLELAPQPALPGSEGLDPEQAALRLGITSKPLSLSGTVYVDAATGNRLLAEVEGRVVPRAFAGGTDPTTEIHILYRERRALSTLPPEVEAPSAEQIFVPRARPLGKVP